MTVFGSPRFVNVEISELKATMATANPTSVVVNRRAHMIQNRNAAPALIAWLSMSKEEFLRKLSCTK